MKQQLDDSFQESFGYPSCFICGFRKSGAYPVSIRQNGKPGPYFPFLETHETPIGAELPSANGKVLSCFACYAFLIQQWESYERDKVPPVKRIYWLKRVDDGPYTGVEMGIQSEYASQVFGLNSEHSNPGDLPKSSNTICKSIISPGSIINIKSSLKLPDNETSALNELNVDEGQEQHEALDLSTEKRGTKRELDAAFKNDNQFPGALDLSMPDEFGETEVCYICGKEFESGTLLAICATEHHDNLPCFPSLLYHSRPKGSVPMERDGSVGACKNCFAFIASVWNNYKENCLPNAKRHQFFKDALANLMRIKCCKCDEPLHPNAKHQADSTSEASSPFNTLAQYDYLCDDCRGDSIKVISKSPKHFSSTLSESTVCDNVACCLCQQHFSLKQMKTLSMVSDPTSPGAMFFPVMKFLTQVNQDMITGDGRVLACKNCYAHMSSQWNEFEKNNIPCDQRQFNLPEPSQLSLSPAENYFESPGPSSSVITTEAAATSVIVYKTNKPIESGIHCEDTNPSKHAYFATAETGKSLPPLTNQKATHVPVYCYICGYFSKSGETFSVHSKKGDTNYYFPFLKKYSSSHSQSTIGDHTYLVCHCCFHSLVHQWQLHEQQNIDQSLRVYDTHNFVCFVCSTKTYRRRLEVVHLKDFPFLKDHSAPVGGLVINDGLSVVVCKDCFKSLKDQYTDLERWGLPVEKRQYNWIQRPPPHPFENLPGYVKLIANSHCQGALNFISTPEQATSAIEPKLSFFNKESCFSKDRQSPAMVSHPMINAERFCSNARDSRDMDAIPTSSSVEVPCPIADSTCDFVKESP